MELFRRLLDVDGTDTRVPWPDRLGELLAPGESVEAEVPVGDDAAVVVTGRRLLAFSPSLAGPNYVSVDRPNVDGVGLGARAPRAHLSRAASLGLLGIVGLVGGLVLDLDAVVGDVQFSSGAAERIGAGGLMGLLRTVLDLFALLDDIFLLGGAIAAIAAVGFVVAYVRGRTPTIVLEVAGDDDVHVPRPAEPRDATARIEAALGLRPPPDPGGPTAPSDQHREA